MKLFVLILNIFFTSMVAAQNIVYCPKEITCKGSILSCSFLDNQNNLWKITGQGSVNKVDHNYVRGTFKFEGATISRDSRTPKNVYDNISCRYQQKHSKGYQTLAVTPMFRLFEPQLVNSLWKDGGGFTYCSFDNSVVCPMATMPGIAIVNANNSLLYYYTDKKTGEYRHAGRLLYDDLIEICGFTSNCIVDLGKPHSIDGPKKPIWYYDHYGTVEVDISTPNEVKFNKLNTDQTQSECVLEKYEPFNAFYCKK